MAKAEQDELDAAFARIQSGDIVGGRAILSRAAARPGCSLDTLCFAAREYSLPPQNEEFVEAFAQVIQRRFPHSTAPYSIAFCMSEDTWRTPEYATAYLQREGDEPALGPHEAAVRLLARVASCNFRVLASNVRPGVELPGMLTDMSIIGAARLNVRDTETALEKFQTGLKGAHKTADNVREFLGANYHPSAADGGASDVFLSCMLGDALARRELGRFAELAGALNALRRRETGFNQLLDVLHLEGVSRMRLAAFPSAWRKPFAEREIAARSRAGGRVARQTKSSGCGLVLAVAGLSSLGLALWRVLQI